MDISIVIVTRNEAPCIARCVDSVLEELAGMLAEILLVDSASTDGTVDIAMRYPVRIIRLSPSRTLSPSAGRYVGTLQSTGKLVFFLDGDMVVIKGWLKAALEMLKEPDVGAVAGRLYRVRPGEDPGSSRVDGLPGGEVTGLGGAGVYRRTVLEECGTFNPFLRGEEERELGYRIGRKGYRILRIDQPMAYHMDKPRTAQEVDEKARHFFGVGQVVRAHPLTSLSAEIIRVQSTEFLTGLLVVGWPVGVVLSLVMGWFIAAVIVLTGVLAAAVGLFIRKGSKGALLFLRGRILTLWHFAGGLIAGVQPPERYTFSTIAPGI